MQYYEDWDCEPGKTVCVCVSCAQATHAQASAGTQCACAGKIPQMHANGFVQSRVHSGRASERHWDCIVGPTDRPFPIGGGECQLGNEFQQRVALLW